MDSHPKDRQHPEAAPQVQRVTPSEQRYRDLFEQAPVGYFLLDAQGVITAVNQAGRRQLGHPLRKLTGRRFSTYLDDSCRSSFEVLLRRVLCSHDAQRLELKLLQAAGETVHVQLDAVQGRSEELCPCARVTLTDITALKEAQDRVSARNTTLENLVQSRTEQIRQLDAEMESFVQAVTHQLQEPLRQATTLSGVLRRAEALTPEKAGHYSQVMLERVAYMHTLLDALDTHFRLARQRAKFIPVSLERVLDDVKKELKPKLRARTVTWQQQPLPTVTGDSRSLQIIFYELLDNALKFSRTRDAVHLRILSRETETEYHVGVQDNGIGFNMRHREKLFGMFHRLHAGKEYEGLGLGLPLVRRAALRHGGRCWAEGEEGQGCTFWVALPKNPVINL